MGSDSQQPISLWNRFTHSGDKRLPDSDSSPLTESSESLNRDIRSSRNIGAAIAVVATVIGVAVAGDDPLSGWIILSGGWLLAALVMIPALVAAGVSMGIRHAALVGKTLDAEPKI